jgi:hypothetical protein
MSKKSKNKKGVKDVSAVLSLDDYKFDPKTTESACQNAAIKNIKRFCQKNIEDIVELETNNSGTNEFEEAMKRGKKE